MAKAVPAINAGDRFSKWTVLGFDGRRSNSLWFGCVCECGVTGIVRGADLRLGKSTQCRACVQKHGGCRSYKLSLEYSTWKAMKRRCLSPTDSEFARYGGRGITICPEWVSDFERFLKDVGPRPSRNYSLDRFPNGNGNYEPGNVRWATKIEQARNVSCNRLISYAGRTQCLAAWAEEYGLTWHLLRNRLKRGWPVEQALNAPISLKYSHRKHQAAA